MNRTSCILKTIRERLKLLQTDRGENYNVLNEWSMSGFDQYQTPYVFVRALGETSQTVANYENSSRSYEVVDLQVEIIVGYSIYTDVDANGDLIDEQLERTHEVRQWLDNGDFTFRAYEDTHEFVEITGLDYSGFNGVTQNKTVGAAVIGNIVSFNSVKKAI